MRILALSVVFLVFGFFQKIEGIPTVAGEEEDSTTTLFPIITDGESATVDEIIINDDEGAGRTEEVILSMDDAVEEDEEEGEFLSERDCKLKSKRGPCRAIIENWFYNSESGQCELFKWSGCGGNKNRFDDKEQCESKCVKNEASSTTSSTISPTVIVQSSKPKFRCPKFEGCPSVKCTIVQEQSNMGCKKCQCPSEDLFKEIKEAKMLKLSAEKKIKS